MYRRSIRAALPVGVGLLSIGCGSGPKTRMNENEPAASASSNALPDGTQIKVRTARLISPRDVAPGERIEAELVEPLQTRSRMRIPAGVTVLLSIIDSSPRITLKATRLRRNMAGNVEVHTASLVQPGNEIDAGSVLTFKLVSPVELDGAVAQ
jgi:hypothetical protein